eukprot:2811005-Amphidinium_carterae.1
MFLGSSHGRSFSFVWGPDAHHANRTKALNEFKKRLCTDSDSDSMFADICLKRPYPTHLSVDT